MSDSLTVTGVDRRGQPGASDGADAELASTPLQLVMFARYGAALVFVAAATVVAFVTNRLIAPPNLSLIFVLPVLAAATWLGWGPSLVTGLTSVLAYDFFFTEPLYSFEIARPSDLWATGLLLVVAAVVSTLAGEARRRTLEARRTADQALALQALAHVVIQSRPQSDVVQAAAIALNRIFQAPAVILAQGRGGELQVVATAGDPVLTEAEDEAARSALEMGRTARAEIYPFDRSAFDFWPVAGRSGAGYVLGVSFHAARRDRPAAPERHMELVGAYLAAAGRSSEADPAF